MAKPTPLGNDQLLSNLLSDLGGNSQEEPGIDLFAYWQVVVKYKWGIVSLTALVALLSSIYVSTLVPSYKAEATLLFDPPSSNNYGTVRDMSAASAYNSYYRNFRLFKAQQSIMRSRKFAEDMVDKTELWKHSYFLGRPGYVGVEPTWKASLKRWLPPWLLELKHWAPDWALELARNAPSQYLQVEPDELERRYRDAAIAALMAGMTVEANEEIMLIKLGFVSNDPGFAADMANRLADYYIQHDLDIRMEAFSQATSWLTERTLELRNNVMKSDLELQQFREEENMVSIEGGSILDREMEDVFQRLASARKSAQNLELVRDRLDSQVGSLSELAGSPELVKYSGVTDALNAAVELENVIADLAQVYGPKHPQMIDAKNRYNRLREKLKSEKLLVQVGVAADLRAARSDVKRLQAEFENLTEQMRDSDKKRFQLESLQRNQQTDQELYTLFVTRFKELNIGSDVSTANAQIIDNAQVPGSAFWPNKPRLIAIYSIVALLFGIALAFLREYLDKTIKAPEEVEDKLGVPLLGTLAQLDLAKGEEVAPERMFVEKNKSLFAESIRTIRTGIMLSGLDDPHKILAITSTVPGEGKTTVSMNIACALGQLERVLLIDADMRRAALGPHFGFPRNTLGLADVAAGIKGLDECIHHYELGGIDILPAGTIPPNPQELLSSARFEEILTEVSARYDRVVIDTAPMHLVSDPMLVARWASAVIYVCRAESTHYHLAGQQLRALEKVGERILGVVLNGVSEHRTTYRGYRRYGGKSYSSYGGYGAHPYAGYVEADEVETSGRRRKKK